MALRMPSDVRQWKAKHALHWLLEEVELPQYQGVFSDFAIDGLLLLSFEENVIERDLKIVRKLHKEKFILELDKIKKQQAKNYPPSPPKNKKPAIEETKVHVEMIDENIAKIKNKMVEEEVREEEEEEKEEGEENIKEIETQGKEDEGKEEEVKEEVAEETKEEVEREPEKIMKEEKVEKKIVAKEEKKETIENKETLMKKKRKQDISKKEGKKEESKGKPSEVTLGSIKRKIIVEEVVEDVNRPPSYRSIITSRGEELPGFFIEEEAPPSYRSEDILPSFRSLDSPPSYISFNDGDNRSEVLPGYNDFDYENNNDEVNSLPSFETINDNDYRSVDIKMYHTVPKRDLSSRDARDREEDMGFDRIEMEERRKNEKPVRRRSPIKERPLKNQRSKSSSPSHHHDHMLPKKKEIENFYLEKVIQVEEKTPKEVTKAAHEKISMESEALRQKYNLRKNSPIVKINVQSSVYEALRRVKVLVSDMGEAIRKDFSLKDDSVGINKVFQMWPRHGITRAAAAIHLEKQHMAEGKGEAKENEEELINNMITRSDFASGLLSLLSISIDWVLFDTLFRFLDVNKDGVIDEKEFMFAFYSPETTKEENFTKAALKIIDHNESVTHGKQGIKGDDEAAIVAICEHLVIANQTLEQVFDKLDVKKLGKVPVHTFLTFFKSLGLIFKPQQISYVSCCIDDNFPSRIVTKKSLTIMVIESYARTLMRLSTRFEQLKEFGNPSDAREINLVEKMKRIVKRIERGMCALCGYKVYKELIHFYGWNKTIYHDRIGIQIENTAATSPRNVTAIIPRALTTSKSQGKKEGRLTMSERTIIDNYKKDEINVKKYLDLLLVKRETKQKYINRVKYCLEDLHKNKRVNTELFDAMRVVKNSHKDDKEKILSERVKHIIDTKLSRDNIDSFSDALYDHVEIIMKKLQELVDFSYVVIDDINIADKMLNRYNEQYTHDALNEIERKAK